MLFFEELDYTNMKRKKKTLLTFYKSRCEKSFKSANKYSFYADMYNTN